MVYESKVESPMFEKGDLEKYWGYQLNGKTGIIPKFAEKTCIRLTTVVISRFDGIHRSAWRIAAPGPGYMDGEYDVSHGYWHHPQSRNYNISGCHLYEGVKNGPLSDRYPPDGFREAPD